VSRSGDAAAAWIYRGVWTTVVSLFRVPPNPPTLPSAGEPVRAIRPAPAFLRYLKFFFWLLLLPADAIPLVSWVALLVAWPVVALALAPLLLAVLVLPDIVAYVALHLRYDTTWYVLTDRSLRIRRGIWVIHETTISFENVQNVEVRQNPVQRYFGIADVVVQTAGGGSSHKKGEGGASGAHVALLQGLADAEAVRALILDRVRHSRSSGLGDEGRDAAGRLPGGLAGLTAAHLSVLREVHAIAGRMAGSAPAA
jgi:membrane protein YdbS with pleckstrin-like domain